MAPKTDKETSKEKNRKVKANKSSEISSSTDGSIVTEESNESVEKTEKQVKIDSMLTQMAKSLKEPQVDDIVAVLNVFDEKLNKLASKEYIDRSLKKLVSEDFVNQKFKSLKEDLGKEIKVELDKVYEQIRKVKDTVKKSVSEIEELKNMQSDMEVKVSRVESDYKEIKKKNLELEELLHEREIRLKSHEIMINNLEQYTRRNSIRIYGLPDDKNESVEESREQVLKMCNDKLKIKLSQVEIDIAHRLGKFTPDGNRPIICKFTSRMRKRSIISVRKLLKGTSIVIREDLTTKTVKLLEKLSARDDVSNVWSDEGKIIALLLNGKKIRVDLHTDLSQTFIQQDELERLLREKQRSAKKD